MLLPMAARTTRKVDMGIALETTTGGSRGASRNVSLETDTLDRDAVAYRPDIDGLRAIAILSVLGFHAFPNLLRGGFVGVDIFFVISGFLITGIILKAQRRDSFSFLDFYARRVRRIFPALLVVLLPVWGLGWLKLLPDEYASLTKHIAAGSAYISNILLYTESSYFDAAAELKPLLHLWSLGVEEQFYIVWPLILVLTWRWPRAQLPTLLALATLSFAFNLLAVKSQPAAAFYLPPARLWELAAGGVLAQVKLSPPGAMLAYLQRACDVRVRNLAAIAGLALLCLSFASIDRTRLFPGLWALAPVAGATLLIAAGERAWINQHLLASRVLVSIGLISYPLYLWHWPLLSMAHILQPGGVAPGVVAATIATAFLLAFLTYRYIELPVRTVSASSLPRSAAALLTCLAVVGVVGYTASIHRWAPLSTQYGVDRIVRARAEAAYPGPRLRRVDGFYVQQAGPKSVLFLGDSNMEQYYPRIDELLTRDPQLSKTAIFATGGGCPPIPGVQEKHHRYCVGLVDRAIEYATSSAVDSIVIAAAWKSYFYEEDERYSYSFQEGGFDVHLAPNTLAAQRAIQAFDRMIKAFSEQHKRVFIVLQIPVGTGLNPRDMIQRGLTTFAFDIVSKPLSRSAVVAELAPIHSQLIEIAERHGARIIDPLDTLCDAEQCRTMDADGNPIYKDGGHLRPSYVRANVRFLDDIVGAREHR
jgi:peptidoglycan/LPS O-acetylase OafA/YrhL